MVFLRCLLDGVQTECFLIRSIVFQHLTQLKKGLLAMGGDEHLFVGVNSQGKDAFPQLLVCRIMKSVVNLIYQDNIVGGIGRTGYNAEITAKAIARDVKGQQFCHAIETDEHFMTNNLNGIDAVIELSQTF